MVWSHFLGQNSLVCDKNQWNTTYFLSGNYLDMYRMCAFNVLEMTRLMDNIYERHLDPVYVNNTVFSVYGFCCEDKTVARSYILQCDILSCRYFLFRIYWFSCKIITISEIMMSFNENYVSLCLWNSFVLLEWGDCDLTIFFSLWEGAFNAKKCYVSVTGILTMEISR